MERPVKKENEANYLFNIGDHVKTYAQGNTWVVEWRLEKAPEEKKPET